MTEEKYHRVKPVMPVTSHDRTTFVERTTLHRLSEGIYVCFERTPTKFLCCTAKGAKKLSGLVHVFVNKITK